MTDWIKSSDRLPEPDVDVLILVRGKFGIGSTYRWKRLDEWVTAWRGNLVPGPSHWMYLPALPEATK